MAEIAGFIADYGSAAWGSFRPLIFTAGLLWLLEWVAPAERQSIRSRFNGMSFWAAYIVLTVPFGVMIPAWLVRIGLKPLAVIDLSWIPSSSSTPLRIMGWFAVPLAGGIFADFFYYWFHRLQHRSALLWRFHRVHHSIRELNAWNCTHHFSESILGLPFTTLPVLAVITLRQGSMPGPIDFIWSLQPLFIHSSTWLHLGPLRYLIADSRFHRIHHSVESQHFDRNFGGFSTVWDQIFSTAFMPQPGEIPATGLADLSPASGVVDYVVMPFRSRA